MSEWKWWDHAGFYGLCIGVVCLAPNVDGSLTLPLWVSLPLVIAGGAWLLRRIHFLKQ